MAFEGLNQRGSAQYIPAMLTVNPNQSQALPLTQQRNNSYNEGLQYAEKLLSKEPSNSKAG